MGIFSFSALGKTAGVLAAAALLLPGISGALAADTPKTTVREPSHEVQLKKLQALVKRTLPRHVENIVFRIEPDCRASFSGENGRILITAPNLSEAVRALGCYMRNVAYIHYSWGGENCLNPNLPVPGKTQIIPAALPYNTAFNYCTLSYTCAHWDKARWSRELDQLALSGYKYVLVTSGLEKVWQNFLRELGCPEATIKRFIPAPTHAAWWNMGNLEGEGGPVSQDLIDSEAELGQFIVKRARDLGMQPILQGYVGFLPHNFTPKGIEGTILQQGKWCGYTRPSVIQPTSPGYAKLAELWYKHLHAVYGIKAAAYGGDLFHEGGVKGNTDLQAAAKAVQSAMQAASPDSVWFLQAWGHNPDARLVRGTDPKHTVILFLNKNMSERPTRKFDFQGRPHVWCELSNFGGNNGLFGGVPLLEKLDGNAGGSCGLGLLSEGLETNPFYYALFTERLNTRSVIDRNEFIGRYALGRYSSRNKHLHRYLSLLCETVYRPDKIREGCLENIQCARPSLWAKKVSTWSDPTAYYDNDKVLEAARELLAAGKESGKALTALPTYRYDLVDVCRQVMADRARKQLTRCREAFEKKDEATLRKECKIFLQQMDETAALLSCSEQFLLGSYLEGARRRVKTAADKAQMERNLRRLITTWRPVASTELDDYANRELSELMGSYYKRRWEVYFDSCIATLRGKAGKDAVGQFNKGNTSNNGENTAFRIERNSKVEAIERAFPNASIPLLTKPRADLLPLAEKILSK